MTADEAQVVLQQISDDEWAGVAPLTPEQLAQLDWAMAQTDAGHVVPHSEVLRRFGRA